MIFSLLKRRKREQGIEPLYGAMMARALDPQLFTPGNVPDTFEGRFESVSLHAALVLRRLAELPAPAADMAQELVDRIFDGVDSAMREVGISDVGVPKRIKTFAKGFYGRLNAYTEALDAGAGADALADALARNVLEGQPPTPDFCAYVRATAGMLAGSELQTFLRGEVPAARMGGEAS